MKWCAAGFSYICHLTTGNWELLNRFSDDGSKFPHTQKRSTATLLSMFEPYYSLLPPHWSYNDNDGTYFNELTQEFTTEHPITIFIKYRKQVINPPPNDPIGIEIERIQYESEMNSQARERTPEISSPSSDFNPTGTDSFMDERPGDALEPDKSSKELDQAEKIPELDLPSGKFYEYYCQWSERDLFGKVSLYGLTFRYYEESRKTLIRFVGLVGEWVYSAIQGPYGPLEHIDFFIGAKIKVFGRQVTISSASASAIKWIEAQKKKLEKQQDRFREKIMAVGQVPCIKARQAEIVRHITRGEGNVPAGHTDLRKMLQANAKLGEQLVSLGLCDQL
jgi:hypothetical protein